MKSRVLTPIITILSAVAGILLTTATWTKGNEGDLVYVTNGNVKIPMPDMKTAEKTKRQLNNEEDKAEKRKEKEEKKSDRPK